MDEIISISVIERLEAIIHPVGGLVGDIYIPQGPPVRSYGTLEDLVRAEQALEEDSYD